MAEHHALVELPAAYAIMFPSLEGLELPEEHRTDCASCPQVAPDGAPPSTEFPFREGVRCCTYQPSVPSYLVGRALVRGGPGAERVRARIRGEAEGIEALGVRGTESLRRLYREVRFGTDHRLACPFLETGPLSCSIWRDRNAVCRTWHCRTTDGGRSTQLWKIVRELLTTIERRLGQWIVEQGAPPQAPAPAEAWETWYLECHARLEAASPQDIAAIPFPERRGLEVALEVYGELLFSPLPEVVVPAIAELVRDEDGFLVRGYSAYDAFRVPSTFMALFGLLAQLVPWREALDRIHTDYGIVFDEDFVEQLWRRGLLTWAPGAETPPEVSAWLRLAEREGVEVGELGTVEPPEAQ